MKPRVVVHIDEFGNHGYLTDGDIDLFCIDERAPNDRVYQFSDRKVKRSEITKLMGKSRVGKLGDMPVTEAAIRALMDGKQPPPRPPLKVV